MPNRPQSSLILALLLLGAGCEADRFLAWTADCPQGRCPDGGGDGGEPDAAQEICNNGVDDDGDGTLDCADSDCTGSPLCPVCGNGSVEPGEDCDDGNTTGGDGCSPTCTLEVEDCENGADDDLDGLIDCEDLDCDGRTCGAGQTCIARSCQ